jgi:hyperosmotically inducible protein
MGPRQEAGLTFRIAVVAMWLVLITPAAWAAQLQPTRGDDQIRVRIEQWFSDHQLPCITVAVHQGEVTLGGTVLNAWARRQAAEQARNVEGVKLVTDELVVGPGASDAAIAIEVRRRVRDYAFYTIYENVEVEVNEGRVTLTGQVLAETSARAMANIAAQVNGVSEVINMIRTLAASSRDDAIREEIAGRLYDDPRFSGDAHETRWPIRIIVEHGRVTLTGMVDSEVAWHAAEAIARGVFGVISVDNKLMTRPVWSLTVTAT